MRAPGEPLFLARRTYRRRRLIDAIRLVPVLGALLFLLPGLNISDGWGGTFAGGVYLFLCWLGLIILTAILSRRVSRPHPDAPDQAEASGAPPEDHG